MRAGGSPTGPWRRAISMRSSVRYVLPPFSLSVFALGRAEPDFDLICLLPPLRPSFLHTPSPENRTYQKRRRRSSCSRKSTANSMPSHEDRFSLVPQSRRCTGLGSQTSEAFSGTFPQVRAYWSLFATGQGSIVRLLVDSAWIVYEQDPRAGRAGWGGLQKVTWRKGIMKQGRERPS